MIDLAGLTTIAAAFFIAAASPGPATIATATVSMHSGRSNGLRFAVGLSVGLAFWGLIAATGIGAILHASAWALTVLKFLGGAYLLWLAYQSARAAGRVSASDPRGTSSGRWFTRGLLLNLSNPKAVVAWMATLSLGISDSHGAMQVGIATALCIAIGFLIYIAYAFAFSMSGAMGVYARAHRWIDGFVAGVFAIAGLSLIRSALSR